MPYKRKTTRRKRRPKTAVPFYRRKYSALQLAQKAYSAAKYIKSVINVEKKKHDLSLSLFANGTVTPLTDVAVGDTDQTRDGNSLLGQSLLIKGYLQSPATLNTSHARVIIFKDNQQISDTSPTITDILDPDSPNPVLAPLNNNTVGRFQILMDDSYSLNNQITGNSININYNRYLKYNKHVRYNGPLSTDVQKGGLYIMLVHDATPATPTLQLFTRFTYTDN